MTEAALAAARFGKRGAGFEPGPADGTDEHLSDPIASVNRHRLASQVHQKDTDLPAVILVDRTRSVRQRQTVARREPAARAEFRLVAGRPSDPQPGSDRRALTRSYDERPVDAGGQIGSRAPLGRIGGKREILGAGQAADEDQDLASGAAAHGFGSMPQDR